MPPTPQLVVRLFAAARDLAGGDTLVVPDAHPPLSVAELRRRIVGQCPQLARLLAVSAVAVNHDFAEDDRLLTPDDEIAVIPPVSGG